MSPFRASVLVSGSSGGGKSTVVTGLVERLRGAGYNFCIIDPEGDYDGVESAVVLGSPEHAPTVDECVQLLNRPDQNAVINMLGVKLSDRPWFFLSLFARIRELRARTGRPHWLIVGEAHHAMPANWQPTDPSLPERLDGVVVVTVSPNLIAPSVLRAVDTILVLGDRPREMLREFTDANRAAPLDDQAPAGLESGTALLWSKPAGGEPMVLRLEPGRTERRRHLWLRNGIKDETLADQAAAIERSERLDAAASRRKLRELIEATYTLPAQ